MEMDFNQVVKDTVAQLDFNSIWAEALKKQVKTTIEKVLQDKLGSYSELSKSFEKLVEKQLQLDLSNVTIPEYSNFVLDQIEAVMKDQVSEERAVAIRKTFAEKLAPHIEQEIEFETLIDAIKEGLRKSIEEADYGDKPTYRIVCSEEEKKFTHSSTPYFQLKIYEGDETKYDSEVAVLCVHGEESYHSRGKQHDPITKRFASYKHLRTKIKGIKEYEATVEHEGDF